MKNEGIVWIVSFGIGEQGEITDYLVEELDVKGLPSKSVKALKEKMGQGVFETLEQAEEWAKAQTSGGCSGCAAKSGKSGCSGCSGCGNRE